MFFTINSFVGSLHFSRRFFRTLKDIYAVCDSTGYPRFRVLGNVVQFEVSYKDKNYVLSCPLSGSFGRTENYEILNLKNPFINEWRLYKNELQVFDTSMNIQLLDVVLQPKIEGLSFNCWVRSMLFSESDFIWRRVIKNLSRMGESLLEDEIMHGSLKPVNIMVRDDCSLIARNYPIVTNKSSEFSDAAMLGINAVFCYIAACEPNIFHEIGCDVLVTTDSFVNYSKFISLQAEFSKNTILKCLTALICDAITEPDESLDKEILKYVRALAICPFVPMSLLFEMLGNAIDGEMEVIVEQEYKDEVNVMSDLTRLAKHKRAIVDFSACEYVSVLSDTLIRIKEDGLWGYASRKGEYMIEPQFDDSCDFYEGRAAVCKGSEWGLINRDGDFVIEPCYELLEWYGRWNVVAALKNGEWMLYDRCGHRLTSKGYDWIGECFEGIMVACKGNKYGYLRADGTPLTDLKFDEAFSYEHGAGVVTINGHQINITFNK